MLFWLKDLLFSKFTEFLSIFCFLFYFFDFGFCQATKKSAVICGRFTSSLLDDQVQGFWLNDQMILGSFLLFAIKIHCSRRCYYAFFHLFHYYILAAN